MRTETVTRVRAGAVSDPYSGTTRPAWSLETGEAWATQPDEIELTTLAPAEPRPSSEPVQDARNAVTSGWTLYLPEGSDVTATDRMVVRGATYEVLGEPAAWLGVGMVVQLGWTEG